VIERVDGPAFDAVVPELAELLVDALAVIRTPRSAGRLGGGY